MDMASAPSSERIDHGRHGDGSTALRPTEVPRNDTVATVRATEITELLEAYGALHREGMLDTEEYEAKRLVLAEWAACARRLRQP
jgi:hypothetical protein